MARRLTSTAPTISIDMSLRLMEARISTPRPPAPMVAAMVITPMFMTTALDHAQALAEGHADAFGGLANAWLNAGEGEVGVTHDGQQGIEEHGGDRRHRPQAL
eukprot:gene17436-20877_t